VALAELIGALRTQAAERRAEELARADAEADRIRAESRAVAERKKAWHVEHAVREAQEAARRSLSAARAEATTSILVARDRLLGRVRAALEARMLAAVDDPDYRAGVANQLAGALERLPVGRVVVHARPELAGLTRNARVDFEEDPAMGIGFVATSPDSGVEIDATLEAELEHRWPRIAVAVLAEVGT
jgi:vacuolar-type H+-ATPase subunit E/Vma4